MASEGANGSSEFSSDEDKDDASEASVTWPPRPPLLRFKMRVQFSSRFKPAENVFAAVNTDLSHKFVETNAEIKDMTLGWINKVFFMQISSEFQLEVTFPIVILTMLDAIYTRRVRWREVDWRYQYKNALQRNHTVLERIWVEVNMEKAREFRVESTPLRMENMLGSSQQDKLDFLRLMKRWYDQRRHHADPYDPIKKRRSIVEQCKHWGIAVKYPPWILYDKEELVSITARRAMDKFRVVSKGAARVMSQPSKSAEQVGIKKCGETVFGLSDGTWVNIEEGYIQIFTEGSAERVLESCSVEEFHSMPEYKRLTWFLGSTDHQTM